MRLSDFEKAAQREIDAWQRDESPLQKAINVTLSPVDWLFMKAIPDEVFDQISNALYEALGALNNASEYTFEAQDILDAAEQFDLEVDTVEALREQPLDRLDKLARSFFSQNTILAALSGGGTGLGGPLLIAADVPKSLPPVPQAEKSKLAAKVERVWRERIDPSGPRRPVSGPEDFVVSVEVTPHPGLGTARALEGARLLRDHGVDVINIADGPRAVVRMANWALGLEVQRELDMEFILHVCCRDRNLLGLQSDLLGVHVMGVRNLVVITGDPPKLGDYPKATAVFDLDSIELLKLVDSLNHGVDPAGKVFDQTTAFFSSCGAEPGSLDYDREINRLAAKVDAGAEMIMTQPVYDPAVLDRFLADTEDMRVPVLVGLLPLASARNAEFLHNEVPGMQIPESIRERMHGAGTGAPARKEGIRIAREMLEAVQDRVVGAYVMPPFSRYRSALEVLEVVGYPQPS